MSLRELAKKIRCIAGYENIAYFPIVEFMENVMPYIFPGFNYEIVDDSALDNIEGLTLPNENLILLSNSVYNDAVNRKGRARFTVAHEIAHYLLIDNGSVALARDNTSIKIYQNPEWQANALASEFLIVPRLSIGMTQDDIAREFGVSFSAAHVHLLQKSKERLP
jgi:Zn-dependent peptidase ImmA (M78 family)